LFFFAAHGGNGYRLTFSGKGAIAASVINRTVPHVEISSACAAFIPCTLRLAYRIPMDFSHIRQFAHKHCRFKLRSGKEVFGVVWEVETPGRSDAKRLFFASVRDYERLH